jgi:hypothetical protein
MENGIPVRTGTRAILLVIAVMTLAMADLDGSAACQAATFPSGVTIESSTPDDGYISPVQDLDEHADPAGLDEFTVTFSSAVQLTTSMVSVQTTGGLVPSIDTVQNIGTGGTEWKVRLDRPIPPGESTTFTFGTTETVYYTSLPGDVDEDTVASPHDKAEWLDAYHSGMTELSRHDIDDDGDVDADDYDRLLALQKGINATQAWLDEPDWNVVCCEDFGVCDFYFADACPEDTEDVGCPCPSSGGS